MKPQILKSRFGSIEVDDEVYHHDIIIRLDGAILKRKKKLSKRKYGPSHKISLQEMEFVYEDGASSLVVGTGQYGRVRLSPEAEAYLQDHKCKVLMAPTQEAIDVWNSSDPRSIGLFHVTC